MFFKLYGTSCAKTLDVQLRQFFIIAGAALLLAGIFFWWQSRTPQTPEQQIQAALDNAETALERRSVSGLMQHLARDFKWNNTSRSEVADLLRGTFFLARDVQITRSEETIKVTGEIATSTGTFRATYRTAPQGPIETSEGRFTFRWRREDGQWKIVEADASGLGAGV